MATAVSNLTGSPKNKNPSSKNDTVITPELITKVEDLSYIDTITHLGKQFTKEEKKRFIDDHKKYKVGMIRTKELDKVVRIFTETFDFSKKVKTATNSFQDLNCSENVDFTEEEFSSPPLSTGEPEANIPEKSPEEDLDPRGAFNLTNTTKVLNHSPETVFTTSDFERLYLAWMNDPKLKISDDDKKTRRNIIKSLFRFIFGTKLISDVTATTLQKKYRIAYTPLIAEDKLPCNDPMSELWKDFHKSLEYRRKSVICELLAAKDALGETTFYTEQKKRLVLGLRDILDIIDRTEYFCMEYGYDDSQHEKEEYKISEEEYSRVLKVFQTFVKDKKEGREPYSHDILLKELSKTKKTPETSKILYAELLKLLTWTEELKETGEISPVEQISKLKETLADNNDLETLVVLLSLLLVLTEKIHALELILQEVKFKLNSTSKVSEIEGEIQAHKKEYEATLDRIRKTEVNELNEIIIELTQLLLIMNSIHKLDTSVSKLQSSLEKVTLLQERLQKIPRTPSKDLVLQKANEMAAKIKSDLEKKIDIQNQESRINQLGSKTGGFLEKREPYINMNTFCESILTLFMTKASENTSFNLDVFMKKAGELLDKLGSPDLVLSELNHIIDSSLTQTLPEEGFKFSKVPTENQAFVEILEDKYMETFDSSQRNLLDSLSLPIIYHSRTPETYEDLLGKSPYFLSHGSLGEGDVLLQGIEGFEEEPLFMTPEERKEVEKDGISLGALLFIYLACLKDREDIENTSIVDSKCRLPTLRQITP